MARDKHTRRVFIGNMRDFMLYNWADCGIGVEWEYEMLKRSRRYWVLSDQNLWDSRYI